MDNYNILLVINATESLRGISLATCCGEAGAITLAAIARCFPDCLDYWRIDPEAFLLLSAIQEGEPITGVVERS